MLEQSEDEVSKWYDDLAAINEEVEKVESICQQEISPDVETLERQRKEAKVDFINVADRIRRAQTANNSCCWNHLDLLTVHH